MAKKERRVTRQIRVYEETARLIDALIRRTPELTFADVVEYWAKSVYPSSYETVIKTEKELDDVLAKEDERKQ